MKQISVSKLEYREAWVPYENVDEDKADILEENGAYVHIGYYNDAFGKTIPIKDIDYDN